MDINELIERLDSTNSPLLLAFKLDLSSCWENSKNVQPNEYAALFPSYSLIKKQLTKQFTSETFQQNKAIVSRTLQSIVERAECMARSSISVSQMDENIVGMSCRSSVSRSNSRTSELSNSDNINTTNTTNNTTTTTNTNQTNETILDENETTNVVNNHLYTWGRFLDSTEDELSYINPSLCDRWSKSSNRIVQVACTWRVSSAFYLTESGDVYRCDGFLEDDPGWDVLEIQRPNHKELIRTFQLQRTLHSRQVIQIGCGMSHTIAVTNDGQCYTWGSGTAGALGHGDTKDESAPRVIAALGEHRVLSVAVGGQHNLFLIDKMSSGNFFTSSSMTRAVFACGANGKGQLGFKTSLLQNKPKSNENKPRQIDTFPKDFMIESVHCGWDFSAVRGYVKSRKNSSYKDTETKTKTKTKTKTSSSKGEERTRTETNGPIIHVLMWGINDHGQCGVGVASTRVSTPQPIRCVWAKDLSVDDLSCGYGHALALIGGQVYVWGNGEDGQLGTHQVLALEPEAVESVHFRDRSGIDTRVVGICAGPFHSVALTAGGRVFSWGMNQKGELGLGHTNNRGTPTQVMFPEITTNDQSPTDPTDSTTATDVQMKGKRQTTYSVESLGSIGSIGSNGTIGAIGDSSSDSQNRRRSISFCDRLTGQINIWTSFHATIVLCSTSTSTSLPTPSTPSSPSNTANDAAASVVKASRIRKERDLETKWLDQVVPRWHKVYKERWVQEMIFQGIPAEIRKYVWPLSIGNGIKATPEMFQITIERAQQFKDLQSSLASSSSSSSPSSPSSFTSSSSSIDSRSPNKAKRSLAVIDADLGRTFPQMKLFGDDGHWGEDLRCVLEAFACHRPDLGYVQGMSYIAAMLLLHIPDRYMVFQCFTNLLVKGHLFPYYRLTGTDHERYSSLFSRVIAKQIPAVAQHLQYLDILPGWYFYPWAQTIFLKYLPAKTASRIWDNFLAGGEVGGTAFVFRTSVAILHLFSQDIIGAEMERVMAILQRRPSALELWETKIEEKKLFATIEKIELSMGTKSSIQKANGNVFEYHPRYMGR